MTKRIQEAFFAAVRGEPGDAHGWLTPVPAASGRARGRRGAAVLSPLMRVAIGSDHAGFALKERLKARVAAARARRWTTSGPGIPSHAVDYPEYSSRLLNAWRTGGPIGAVLGARAGSARASPRTRWRACAPSVVTSDETARLTRNAQRFERAGARRAQQPDHEDAVGWLAHLARDPVRRRPPRARAATRSPTTRRASTCGKDEP